MPIGPDQMQHLEFAIRIAEKLNQRDSPLLKIPKAMVFETKIRSLTNPSAKMSKSDRDPHGCLYLTDSPDAVERKLAKAVTDSYPGVSYDPEHRPGVSSLLQLHSYCSGRPIGEVADRYSGSTGCLGLKEDLARIVNEKLGPVRESYGALANNPHQVEEILRAGAVAARAVASETYSLLRNVLLM